MYSQDEIFPAYNLTITENGSGEGPLGRTGGVTYTYASTDGVFPDCALIGFILGVDAGANMNNLVAPPSASCSYIAENYFTYTSGENTGSLVLTGSSQLQGYNILHTGPQTFTVTTKAKISTLDGVFILQDDLVYLDVAGLASFSLTVEYLATGPPAGYISEFANYFNIELPIVTLFDALSTESTRSICTTFASRFYGSGISGDAMVTCSDDSGIGTLRYLLANICAGDTIGFADIIDVEDTVKLTSALEVPSNVVIEGIKGNIKMVISGQFASRIFNFPANTVVSLIDLELIRGVHASTGGAFEVPAFCTLNNVTFKENNILSNHKSISLTALSNLNIHNVVDIQE